MAKKGKKPKQRKKLAKKLIKKAKKVTEVNRLICDFQSLNETDMEILNKLTSKTSTHPEL